jgi:Icc protein
MGVNSHENLTKVVDKITTLQSDALLISGDLTHNGTLHSYCILYWSVVAVYPVL